MTANATQTALTEEQRREKKNQADRERRAAKKAAEAEGKTEVTEAIQDRAQSIGDVVIKQAESRARAEEFAKQRAETDDAFRAQVLEVFNSIQTQLSTVADTLVKLADTAESFLRLQEELATAPEVTTSVDTEVTAAAGLVTRAVAMEEVPQSAPRDPRAFTANGVYTGAEVYALEHETIKDVGRIIEGLCVGLDMEKATLRVIENSPAKREFIVPSELVYLHNQGGFTSVKAHLAQNQLIAGDKAAEAVEEAASEDVEEEESEEEETEEVEYEVEVGQYILDSGKFYKITRIAVSREDEETPVFWTRLKDSSTKVKFEGMLEFVRVTAKGNPVWKLAEE